MEETEKSRFRKGDWLAIAAVLLLALCVGLCFLPSNAPESPCAEIYHKGEKIKTLLLREDQTFTISDRYVNEITVSGGRIAITASDCPGEDCVHSGWTDSSGKVIVCLPNKVEIRIVSARDDVDFVVG